MEFMFAVAVTVVIGFIAGIANTLAGGGTFIAYPALLAAGVSPISANMTVAVGLLPGYGSSSFAYSSELKGQGNRVVVYGIAVAVASGAGAGLLLITTADTFQAVVPWLVLLGSILVLLQPWVRKLVLHARNVSGVNAYGVTRTSVATIVLLGLAALYGGFFGAGIGVLLLGVLGSFVDDSLQKLNALRTLLALFIRVTAVAVFIISGEVAWSYVSGLIVGAYGGGICGVSIVQRLSDKVLRWAVALAGFIVVALLLLKQ